jgi:hypothetical protein
MSAGEAPCAISDPMSRRFTSTTMSRVLTMLRAATRTMRPRIRAMTAFSTRMKAKRFWFISIQSVTR